MYSLLYIASWATIFAILYILMLPHTQLQGSTVVTINVRLWDEGSVGELEREPFRRAALVNGEHKLSLVPMNGGHASLSLSLFHVILPGSLLSHLMSCSLIHSKVTSNILNFIIHS